MKKPFAVGDRVKFYAFFIHGESKGYVGRPGTVVSLEGSGMRVKVDGYGELSAHQKQCRRLKKKAKVTLMPGEVAVSYDLLVSVWNDSLSSGPLTPTQRALYPAEHSIFFSKICNDLGLEKP